MLSEKVQEVIDLFSDKTKWTQGSNARDAEGDEVHPNSPKACCWCLNGGLMKVAEYLDYLKLFRLVTEISSRKFDMNAINVNDTLGYEQVMELLHELKKETMTQDVKAVARKIGDFYLHKNEGDYRGACQDLLYLQLTHMEIKDGVLFLHTNCPGRLLGKWGKNFNNLLSYLNMDVKIIENREHFLQYLLPTGDDEKDWDFPDPETWIEEWEDNS